MDDVRGGSTGFSSAGFTMNGVTPSYNTGLSGPTGAEGKSGPSVIAPIPENRCGVFRPASVNSPMSIALTRARL